MDSRTFCNGYLYIILLSRGCKVAQLAETEVRIMMLEIVKRRKEEKQEM